MKKIILIILEIFLICGCNKEDKYTSFEHFDLKGREKISYNYMDENSNLQEYALSDITKERNTFEGGGTTGLFYKINTNDYILIDEIDNCGASDILKNTKYNYFDGNRLYLRRCTGTNYVIEYILNNKNFEKKEIYFQVPSILNQNDILASDIEKVDKEYLFVNAKIRYEDKAVLLKCSLEDYKCELNEVENLR